MPRHRGTAFLGPGSGGRGIGCAAHLFPPQPSVNIGNRDQPDSAFPPRQGLTCRLSSVSRYSVSSTLSESRNANDAIGLGSLPAAKRESPRWIVSPAHCMPGLASVAWHEDHHRQRSRPCLRLVLRASRSRASWDASSGRRRRSQVWADAGSAVSEALGSGPARMGIGSGLVRLRFRQRGALLRPCVNRRGWHRRLGTGSIACLRNRRSDDFRIGDRMSSESVTSCCQTLQPCHCAAAGRLPAPARAALARAAARYGCRIMTALAIQFSPSIATIAAVSEPT